MARGAKPKRSRLSKRHYGFSTWFAWCSDRFGVSWQLNVA
jgi:predicted 3-demethylubiquinone-9 3-methyltransferase (glyoxalase superfamily)